MGTSCRAGVVPAVACSVALVLTGLSVPPTEQATHAESRARAATAQVESVVLTAFEESGLTLTAPAAAEQLVPAAAATADVGTTIGRIALTAVGLAIAPLWYLATPITLPVTMIAFFAGTGVNLSPSPVPDMGVTAMLQAMVLVFGFYSWLAFPLMLPALVFPNPAADTTTPQPAASRSGSPTDAPDPAQKLAEPSESVSIAVVEADQQAVSDRATSRGRSHRPAPAPAPPVPLSAAATVADDPGQQLPAPTDPAHAPTISADPSARKGSAASRNSPRGADTATRAHSQR